jgi:chemotaxis protein CheX
MHPDFTSTQALTEQRSVAQQVLLTMADIHLLPEEKLPNIPLFTEDPLASLLHYGTPANQSLLLECSPGVAFRLTSRLFDRPEPTSTTDEDVLDTMAELVNIIGGNLKGLMPPETLISLPVVLRWSETQSLLDSARQLSKVWLRTTSGMLCITFLEAMSLSEDSARP